MKIQHSQWDQIDITRYRTFIDQYAKKIAAVLRSDEDLDILSASNSSTSGFWGGYSYEMKGANFISGSVANIRSISFDNGLEFMSIQGNAGFSKFNDSFVSGHFSRQIYKNNVGDSLEINGKLMFDTNYHYMISTATSFRLVVSGNIFEVRGDLQIGFEGELGGGKVNYLEFRDSHGRYLVASDISLNISDIPSLINADTSLVNLYAALSFDDNDTVSGTSGDDSLDGGAGTDNLIGGQGNDTYLVDLLSNGTVQDKITEAKNAGIDTLQLRGDVDLASASTIKLAKNVENLDISLTNDSLLNLTGDNAANTLTGNAANNVIDGGKAADTMIGGAGNDTYALDNAGDIVIEASNGGTDQVNIKFNGSYTLADNVENGFVAHSKAFTLNGNSLNNTLTGGNGKNILDGGVGDDTLTGGKGADTFVFKLADVGTAGAPSNDTITDFSVKLKDVLDLRDLLPSANENDMTGLLTYIDVSTDGSHTQLHISTSAGFANGVYDAAAENATITLSGVNLLAGTSENALLQNLINKNQLLID